MFTYVLTTDVGSLRLRIGDTVENNGPRPYEGAASNFSDEELQHFLTLQGSVASAVTQMFYVLAAEWSAYTNITIGPRREEFAKIADQYAKRAQASKEENASTGAPFSVGWTRDDGYHEYVAGSEL
jgi:hypothetical protein